VKTGPVAVVRVVEAAVPAVKVATADSLEDVALEAVAGIVIKAASDRVQAICFQTALDEERH
jgi:hypothetical protein